jgi:hypothetical protein
MEKSILLVFLQLVLGFYNEVCFVEVILGDLSLSIYDGSQPFTSILIKLCLA